MGSGSCPILLFWIAAYKSLLVIMKIGHKILEFAQGITIAQREVLILVQVLDVCEKCFQGDLILNVVGNHLLTVLDSVVAIPARTGMI